MNQKSLLAKNTHFLWKANVDRQFHFPSQIKGIDHFLNLQLMTFNLKTDLINVALKEKVLSKIWATSHIAALTHLMMEITTVLTMNLS
jgi:hypothetical protein